MSTHNTCTEIRRIMMRQTDATAVALFDLDEVVWDVNYAYIEEVNKALGTNHRLEDMHTYSFVDALGVSHETFHNILHNTDAFERVVPCPFSRELIEGIRDGSLCGYFGLPSEPHKIVFITHRGFRADGVKITHDLLVKHDIIPDELVAAPLGTSKLAVADDLYGEDIVMVFEDHPDTLREFLAAGIPAVKSLRPWNKDVWTDYSVNLNLCYKPTSVV